MPARVEHQFTSGQEMVAVLVQADDRGLPGFDNGEHMRPVAVGPQPGIFDRVYQRPERITGRSSTPFLGGTGARMPDGVALPCCHISVKISHRSVTRRETKLGSVALQTEPMCHASNGVRQARQARQSRVLRRVMCNTFPPTDLWQSKAWRAAHARSSPCKECA
jgi:hypothetical protein